MIVNDKGKLYTTRQNVS